MLYLVSCLTQLVSDADRCYRIGGYVTLYGIGNVSLWAPEVSVAFIQTSMNNGYFNTIHPDVKSVQFITIGPYYESPNTDDSSNRTNVVHEDPFGGNSGGGGDGNTNTGITIQQRKQIMRSGHG